MGFAARLSPDLKEQLRAQTHQLVVQADYGMDVYRKYLTPYLRGKVLKLGYSYISPLRPEKHASFNLFRSTHDQCVWWMDQASQGGDCLTFIMRLFNCDYRDAVRKLRSEILGLPADADKLELLTNFRLKAMPPPPPPPIEYPKFITPIVREDDFYQGVWASQDEKYFPQHIFGAEYLHTYYCTPLAGYQYQQYNPDPKLARDFRVGADWYIGQGMYAYSWGEGKGGHHKIVRPYTPPKNGRRMKWISNTLKEEHVFGEHLLPADGEPPVEAACLLAGNRDAIAYHRLAGVPALATTAEGHMPTPEQLARWRTKALRWYVLYDNDKTGQAFEQRLITECGFTGGLSTILQHYQENDLTKLLIEKIPPHQHQRLGTWFRQAMGLF